MRGVMFTYVPKSVRVDFGDHVSIYLCSHTVLIQDETFDIMSTEVSPFLRLSSTAKGMCGLSLIRIDSEG